MSSWASLVRQLADLDPADFDPADFSDEQLREALPLIQIGLNRHTAVHEGGFGIARDAGTATWHTYRPDGSEIQIRGPSP
jgi:hypothetical protein